MKSYQTRRTEQARAAMRQEFITAAQSVLLHAVAPLVALTFTAWLVWGVTAGLLNTLPPCATEDAANCYWDAQTMGNGVHWNP